MRVSDLFVEDLDSLGLKLKCHFTTHDQNTAYLRLGGSQIYYSAINSSG